MEDISREVRVPAEHILNIFGQFDGHIKKLERQFKVAIVDRNGKITVSGNARAVERVTAIINELVELSERGNIIQEQNVDYAITMSMEENDDVLLEIDKDCICHTIFLQDPLLRPERSLDFCPEICRVRWTLI